ncbi:MAG: hypothetical protein NC397_09320 [Clostridium sp.]|nr:hypothetical protein [Clostridium sp.]
MAIEYELIEISKEACYLTDTASKEELSRLTSIVEDATIKVAHLLGVSNEFDFTKPSIARPIFKSYVLYAWNDVAEEFERNYLADISQAQDYYRVHGENDIE